jgi:cell division protein FtsB
VISYNRRAPPISCPDFNAAIEHIEAARAINSTLREDNYELTSENNDLYDQIEVLKARIETLEKHIEMLVAEPQVLEEAA